jgi:hypothetical protein
MKNRSLFSLAAIAFTAILIATPAKAQIVWGSVSNITGDSNVATNGTYFDAALLDTNTALGASGTVGVSDFVAINGVEFNTIGGQNTGNDAAGDISIVSGRNPFTGANSPSGDAAYNTLVNHAEYTQNGTQTLTLHNLTIGDTYQVQVWSAAIGQGAFITDLAGTNSPSLNAKTGQFVVGTFTATATSFVVTSVNDSTSVNGVDMLNAISVFNEGVASVPEPSSYVLLLSGVLALAFFQFRRSANL